MVFLVALSLFLLGPIYGGEIRWIFGEQPPLLDNTQMSVQFIQDNGICVPEFCWAKSQDAQKNPLLIIGASPCVAAFITVGSTAPILAFHISAHNDLSNMVKIVDTEYNIGSVQPKPKVYVTLFTRTSSKDFSGGRFFNEGTHDDRCEAVAKLLQEKYAVENSQIYSYRTGDYGSPAADHLKDRNVICTGFDVQQNRLKVYSVDLNSKIFGHINITPLLINEFAADAIYAACHENKDIIEQEKDTCSNYKERELSLLIGDRWDHPFYKIAGPNIRLIMSKYGKESIATIPVAQEKTMAPKVEEAKSFPGGTGQKPNSPIHPYGKPWYTRMYDFAKTNIKWIATVGVVGAVGAAVTWWYAKFGRTMPATAPDLTKSAVTRRLQLPSHRP